MDPSKWTYSHVALVLASDLSNILSALDLAYRMPTSLGYRGQLSTLLACQINDIAFHPNFMPDREVKSEIFGVCLPGFISGEDY
jgi:hypothetical protein